MKRDYDDDTVADRVAAWYPHLADRRRYRCHTDATDFYGVNYGDVLLLNDRAYLILNNAKEGRFGLDDQEKFWVKRAVDLSDGQRKIIKLVFHEQFTARIGNVVFDCFRSPRKEARILAKVADHPRFMHGCAVTDSNGNIIRVLDYIYGRTLHDAIADLNMDHEQYFFELLPAILAQFTACVEAIRFLHRHGEKHGDIRRDHIIIDRNSGDYRWIDFDFNIRHRENSYGYDLFGLGNVLIFLAGKGDVLIADLVRQSHPSGLVLRPQDGNIVFHHRLANLQKIYPYIPESLNRILLHFSVGANWFYETVDQLLEDLARVTG